MPDKSQYGFEIESGGKVIHVTTKSLIGGQDMYDLVRSINETSDPEKRGTLSLELMKHLEDNNVIKYDNELRMWVKGQNGTIKYGDMARNFSGEPEKEFAEMKDQYLTEYEKGDGGAGAEKFNQALSAPNMNKPSMNQINMGGAPYYLIGYENPNGQRMHIAINSSAPGIRDLAGFISWCAGKVNKEGDNDNRERIRHYMTDALKGYLISHKFVNIDDNPNQELLKPSNADKYNENTYYLNDSKDASELSGGTDDLFLGQTTNTPVIAHPVNAESIRQRENKNIKAMSDPASNAQDYMNSLAGMNFPKTPPKGPLVTDVRVSPNGRDIGLTYSDGHHASIPVDQNTNDLLDRILNFQELASNAGKLNDANKNIINKLSDYFDHQTGRIDMISEDNPFLKWKQAISPLRMDYEPKTKTEQITPAVKKETLKVSTNAKSSSNPYIAFKKANPQPNGSITTNPLKPFIDKDSKAHYPALTALGEPEGVPEESIISLNNKFGDTVYIPVIKDGALVMSRGKVDRIYNNEYAIKLTNNNEDISYTDTEIAKLSKWIKNYISNEKTIIPIDTEPSTTLYSGDNALIIAGKDETEVNEISNKVKAGSFTNRAVSNPYARLHANDIAAKFVNIGATNKDVNILGTIYEATTPRGEKETFTGKRKLYKEAWRSYVKAYNSYKEHPTADTVLDMRNSIEECVNRIKGIIPYLNINEEERVNLNNKVDKALSEYSASIGELPVIKSENPA